MEEMAPENWPEFLSSSTSPTSLSNSHLPSLSELLVGIFPSHTGLDLLSPFPGWVALQTRSPGSWLVLDYLQFSHRIYGKI
jgi:hypothetical protein